MIKVEHSPKVDGNLQNESRNSSLINKISSDSDQKREQIVRQFDLNKKKIKVKKASRGDKKGQVREPEIKREEQHPLDPKVMMQKMIRRKSS